MEREIVRTLHEVQEQLLHEPEQPEAHEVQSLSYGQHINEVAEEVASSS